MRGCARFVLATVGVSLVAACGGGATGDVDAGPDAGACGATFASAWSERVPPARGGTLLGGSANVLIVGAGESGHVSVDGGLTWHVAWYPGPVDAGPVPPFRSAAVDPRTGRFYVEAGWFPSESTVLRHAGDGDFAYTTLGWPIAPDYDLGGLLHEHCTGASCALARRAGSADTDLLVGRVVAIATFEAAPQRILVVSSDNDVAGTLRVSTDGGTAFTEVAALAPGTVRQLVTGAGPLEVWAVTSSGLAHSDDGGATWVTSAREVTGVLADASTPGAAHATGPDGVLARTTDRGQSWTPVETPYGVHTVVATGDGLVIHTAVGLLRSQGGDWVPLDAPFYPMLVDEAARVGDALLVVPFTSASLEPAWRSTDDGATWSPTPGLRDLVTLAGMQVAYARVAVGWVRSSDAGATWSPVETEIDIDAIGATPGLLYGTITYVDEDVGRAVMVRSRDDGATYDELAPPVGQLWRVRPDPLDPQRVYVLGAAETGNEGVVLRSDDQGDTWTVIGDAWWAPLPDPVTPDRVWRISNFTLGRSDDAGATWTELYGGPSNPEHVVIDRDGRPIVHEPTTTGPTGSQLWTLAPTGAWQMAGTVPVRAGTAIAGACADDLFVVPDNELSYGPLYFTRTLGLAP